MAARDGRAVRAVPGATSDRCDSFQSKPPDASVGAIPSRFVPEAIPQISAEYDRARSPRPRLIRELSASSEVANHFVAVGGQGPSPEHKRFPRAVVRNPYALIYALEQHRGSFEIAILLYREGEVSKYRMRQQLLPRQKALDQALRGLVKMGLVGFECSQTFPFEKR